MIFITALTEAAADNISRNSLSFSLSFSLTLHTVFEIDTWKTKETVKSQQKIEKIWHNKIAIIVNKMSMVSLDLLVTMDLYLDKAKALHKNISAVFSGLLLVIIFFCDFF